MTGPSRAPGLVAGAGPAGPRAEPELSGLSSAEVAERVAAGQVNDVPVRCSRSLAEIVRANVFTRFNAIIGACCW